MKDGKLSSIPSHFFRTKKLATAKFLDVSLKFQETPGCSTNQKGSYQNLGAKKRSSSSLMLSPETIDLELPQHDDCWKIHHFFSRRYESSFMVGFPASHLRNFKVVGWSLKRTATFRP